MARIFGDGFTDMLSGYRALSRRYVKSFPALSTGFETETELTIHALELRAPHGEVRTPYGARLEGSESKLSTWADGIRILGTILRLHMLERPLAFYLTLALAGVFVSLGLGLPVIVEYCRNRARAALSHRHCGGGLHAGAPPSAPPPPSSSTAW